MTCRLKRILIALKLFKIAKCIHCMLRWFKMMIISIELLHGEKACLSLIFYVAWNPALKGLESRSYTARQIQPDLIQSKAIIRSLHARLLMHSGQFWKHTYIFYALFTLTFNSKIAKNFSFGCFHWPLKCSIGVEIILTALIVHICANI